jgi:type III secretory pathway component EscV
MLLPDLVWIPSPETPAGMLAIRINDALEVAQPGLQSGEILVNAPPAQWTPAAPEARPCAHPVTGAECTILPETYREVAAGAGTVWTPAEFAALLLAAEARRLAERLLTIDDVEGQIAELDTAFPELTRAALARFSLEDITRVLRGLLRERISIRNLRGILEQLLRYDTVRAGSRTNIVLDGRLPVGNKAAGADGWLHYREFVRMGLRDQLSARYTHGLETLTAFLVAPEIEARAEDMMTAAGPVIAFDEDLHQSLCRAVWEEVGPVRAIASRAVILTAASTRAVIREMIAGEFPDLPVAAYSDLRPDLTIQPIARLGQKQSAQN